MKILNKACFSAFIVLFILNLSACTPKPEDYGIDMSLTVEISQSEKILEEFLVEKSNELDKANLTTAIEEYIPKEAWCTDVSIYEEIMYVDYQLNGIRYLVAYYADGTVEKSGREITSDDIFFINSKDNEIRHRKTIDTSE